jgi:hypothetical protein
MKTRKLCAVATVLCMVPATSWAGCASPRDAVALKTAGLQQQLMVAALTCNDISLYNRFVVSYRTQLQRSDSDLESYFRHQGAGAAGYHAFKTHLANQSSLDSLHDPYYCAKAKTAFDDALESGKSELAEIVQDRDIPPYDGVEACEASAGGRYGVRTANRRDD